MAIILTSCDNLNIMDKTIRLAWKIYSGRLIKVTLDPCPSADDHNRIAIDITHYRNAVFNSIFNMDLKGDTTLPATILYDTPSGNMQCYMLLTSGEARFGAAVWAPAHLGTDFLALYAYDG